MTRIKIYKFENIETKETQFEIMGIDNTHQIYNASEWKLLEAYDIPNLEIYKRENI